MTGALRQHLDRDPLVAILRGLSGADARPVADALVDAGWMSLEVPLNRPGALQALQIVSEHLEGNGVRIGAGTVVGVKDFEDAQSAGATFFLSPHTNQSLLEYASHHGLDYVPGCATPSDVMTAAAQGATVVKIFPYSVLGPDFVTAVRSVVDDSMTFMAVGGIDLGSVRTVLATADFAGIGSALFRPGQDRTDLASDARRWREMVTS